MLVFQFEKPFSVINKSVAALRKYSLHIDAVSVIKFSVRIFQVLMFNITFLLQFLHFSSTYNSTTRIGNSDFYCYSNCFEISRDFSELFENLLLEQEIYGTWYIEMAIQMVISEFVGHHSHVCKQTKHIPHVGVGDVRFYVLPL